MPTGNAPTGVAVDPVTGWAYIANYNGGTVTVLNGSTSVTTVSVGSDPWGVVFDPHNGLVYVSDSGSGLVSVLNGATVVGRVNVQAAPLGLAVDPGTGFVYVADSGTHNLSVISGTSVVGTVGVGAAPTGVAYSPLNGDVYVADNGEQNVSVVNGTSVVARLPTEMGPASVAFEPHHGYVYVTDLGASHVTVISGLSDLGNVSVGSGPYAVGADGANGEVYVTSEVANDVSVLNGLKVVTTIGTGNDPRGVAFDPQNGVVYVTNYDDNSVSQISTVLGIDTPSVADGGYSVQASDVGQSLVVSTDLWGIGAQSISASLRVEPSPGMGCAGSPTVSAATWGDEITVACGPTVTGIYTLWLNATDATGARVWSEVTLPVDSALNIPAPTLSVGYFSGVASAETNQSIPMAISPSGGSGVFVNFTWIGLGAANCSSLHAPSIRCEFPTSGSYAVSVSVVDSNLASSTGNVAPLRIFDALVATTPTGNHSSADISESIQFSENPIGGPGKYSYSWSGFGSAVCSGTTTATPVCTFSASGPTSIAVTVTDPTGGLSVSPKLGFTIFPLPVVTDPESNRTVADVGQSIGFSTNASGGFGNYTFRWPGLPSNCGNASTAQPTCIVEEPGSVVAAPQVIDGNGGIANAPIELIVPVYADPVVAAPTLSSGTITLGSSVTFSVDPTEGSGGYSFRWSGLPPGCAGTTSDLLCTPTEAGHYSVVATVRDSSGFAVTSAVSNLTVNAPASATSFLTPVVLGGVLVVVAAIVVIAAVWIVRRRRGPGNALASAAPPTLFEIEEGAAPPE